MESEWAILRIAIVEAVAQSCGNKVAVASCGSNPKTRWWTGVVKLKDTFKAWLACETPKATDSYRQTKQSAARSH